ENSSRVPVVEPTLEWVKEQLAMMVNVLHRDLPVAAATLRQLVGGRIVVQEQQKPNSKRRYLQGRFLMQTVSIAWKENANTAIDNSTTRATLGEEMVIDFMEPTPAGQIADEVKRLWDEGLTYKQIAVRVGWNRNIVTEALSIWHRRQGLKPPDGRTCKARLERETQPEKLSDQAKQLFDQGLLMQEIAECLGCNRDTVTQAIAYWFRSRGLPVPDGRTRRKQLPRKTSRFLDSQNA
ncbi:MAG: hypothetical protein AB7K24_33880, partial [Gemmataceae bacterium]